MSLSIQDLTRFIANDTRRIVIEFNQTLGKKLEQIEFDADDLAPGMLKTQFGEIYPRLMREILAKLKADGVIYVHSMDVIDERSAETHFEPKFKFRIQAIRQ